MTLPLPEPGDNAAGAGRESLPDNVRQLRPAGARFGEWPLALVCAVILISLGVASSDHFRRGAVLFSFAIVLAFFLRLLLPDRDAGLLAVRSKRIDLVTLGVLGLAVSLLAFLVPPPS